MLVCSNCKADAPIAYATNNGVLCETCDLIRFTFAKQGVMSDPLATLHPTTTN